MSGFGDHPDLDDEWAEEPDEQQGGYDGQQDDTDEFNKYDWRNYLSDHYYQDTDDGDDGDDYDPFNEPPPAEETPPEDEPPPPAEEADSAPAG